MSKYIADFFKQELWFVAVLQGLTDALISIVEPRFLHQLSEKSPGHDQGDLFKLWTDLKFQQPYTGDQLPKRIHSLAQLKRLHDDVSIKYRALNEADISKMRFPDPPYRGNLEIMPIGTSGELLSEGEMMSHCVASYARSICTGSYFVYRICASIRATMAIRRVGGTWELAEIKGYDNAPVSNEIALALFARLVSGTAE